MNCFVSPSIYISKGYGLKLNKGKCVATIAVNNDGATHFEDAAPLTKEFEAMYLGNEIDKTAKNNLILNKMSEVRRTRFKLEPYWKASGASKKWKLFIYGAIIRSKLLYGLEPFT